MEEILKYLKENFDSNASIRQWNAKKYLSIGLAAEYEYYSVSILSEEFLMIRPLEPKTVQKVKIQLGHIYEKSGSNIVVLLDNSTPYMMRRMLEEKIPFLELGKQMYLPFMTLHIRNHRKVEQKEISNKKFAPTTQLIYLAILYWSRDTFEVEDIARQLQVSDITISRATTELEVLGLIRSVIGGKTGRKKLYTRIDVRQYYVQGKEYLQDQRTKTIFLKEIPLNIALYKTGLTALAEQTMLGEPAREIYAAYSKKAKDFFPFQITIEEAMEEKAYEVQLIKYDVGALARIQYVDPLTLLLGIDETDDRIEMAVEELMEKEIWYEE